MVSGTAVDNAVEVVTVDVIVDVVFDVVVIVVIFVDALEVVVGGIFEVDISFVNVLNCVGVDRGVVDVPEPPIALFGPVELLSDLIGTLVVITGFLNISSSLTLALFSVDVTTIDASFSVLFDVIGLVVDVSDVVPCIEKVFDELIEVDVVGSEFVTLFAITLFVVAFFIVAGLIVEVAFAFECTQ